MFACRATGPSSRGRARPWADTSPRWPAGRSGPVCSSPSTSPRTFRTPFRGFTHRPSLGRACSPWRPSGPAPGPGMRRRREASPRGSARASGEPSRRPSGDSRTARSSCRCASERVRSPTARSPSHAREATGTSSRPTLWPPASSPLAAARRPAHSTTSNGTARSPGLVRAGAYSLYGAGAGGAVPARSGTDEVYGLNLARFLAAEDDPDALVLGLYGQLAAAMTPNTFVWRGGERRPARRASLPRHVPPAEQHRERLVPGDIAAHARSGDTRRAAPGLRHAPGWRTRTAIAVSAVPPGSARSYSLTALGARGGRPPRGSGRAPGEAPAAASPSGRPADPLALDPPRLRSSHRHHRSLGRDGHTRFRRSNLVEWQPWGGGARLRPWRAASSASLRPGRTVQAGDVHRGREGAHLEDRLPGSRRVAPVRVRGAAALVPPRAREADPARRSPRTAAASTAGRT